MKKETQKSCLKQKKMNKEGSEEQMSKLYDLLKNRIDALESNMSTKSDTLHQELCTKTDNLNKELTNNMEQMSRNITIDNKTLATKIDEVKESIEFSQKDIVTLKVQGRIQCEVTGFERIRKFCLFIHRGPKY